MWLLKVRLNMNNNPVKSIDLNHAKNSDSLSRERYLEKRIAKTGLNFSELMTEEELIEYLRIPEISNSNNFRNVVENLKRMHDLPRIHICGKALYPREAVKEWIKRQITTGR